MCFYELIGKVDISQLFSGCICLMKIPREKSSEKRGHNQAVTARDRLLAIREVLNARDGKTLRGSYDFLLQVRKRNDLSKVI